MNFIHQIERLQKLNRLIRQEKTGTPTELAKKLGIKRRTLYDMLESIRSLGLELKYDRKNKTFYYIDGEINIHFSLEILRDEEIIRIFGGSTTFSFQCNFSAQSPTILVEQHTGFCCR